VLLVDEIDVFGVDELLQRRHVEVLYPLEALVAEKLDGLADAVDLLRSEVLVYGDAAHGLEELKPQEAVLIVEAALGAGDVGRDEDDVAVAALARLSN
jgi:hypothetical protein